MVTHREWLNQNLEPAVVAAALLKIRNEVATTLKVTGMRPPLGWQVEARKLSETLRGDVVKALDAIDPKWRNLKGEDAVAALELAAESMKQVDNQRQIW